MTLLMYLHSMLPLTLTYSSGKKGSRGSDFDDDGYKYMLCVEPANAVHPVRLEEGGRWLGTFKMSAILEEDADIT